MTLEDIKFNIQKALGVESALFSYPPRPELGDLSLACFEAAKTSRQNPADLAKAWAGRLSANKELQPYFQEIRAVGPYLNFFIKSSYLAAQVLPAIRSAGDEYGRNQSGQAQKVMIEYSNGNTHKEYHVGHLRNIAYGDAVNRLLAKNGYQVIPVSYINDFGIHVAKTLWNWQRDKVYAERPEPKGYLLGRCYAKATQALAENPAGKVAVAAIMQEIEGRRGASYQLWLETRRWSIDYFDSIYRELGIKFTHIFYENEVVDAGRKLVDELLEKGILVRSEGAIIADLEPYGLGVLPIIRSDGTALYPVADLALASEKFRRYDINQSIYVIDVRQSLYFKQLIKILELSGYRPAVRHLAYDFVTLPEGMMSSRTGNVITYQELRDKIFEKLTAETAQRHRRWSERRIKQVAFNLTVSTIKFEMLKIGADKTITFNINEALRFDGYTACYLQYGYARLRSILRKGWLARLFGRPDFTTLSVAKEKALLLALARYPEVIAQAGTTYRPSELTQYLFELVQLSNDYYHETNILKAASRERRARLALIAAVTQVLQNGFTVLGLRILEKM
ncbi:MAG: arginine--tRNA ligase [Patescibacteria group bacterium]